MRQRGRVASRCATCHLCDLSGLEHRFSQKRLSDAFHPLPVLWHLQEGHGALPFGLEYLRAASEGLGAGPVFRILLARTRRIADVLCRVACEVDEDPVAHGLGSRWEILTDERGYPDTAARIIAHDADAYDAMAEDERGDGMTGFVVGQVFVGVLVLGHRK